MNQTCRSCGMERWLPKNDFCVNCLSRVAKERKDVDVVENRYQRKETKARISMTARPLAVIQGEISRIANKSYAVGKEDEKRLKELFDEKIRALALGV